MGCGADGEGRAEGVGGGGWWAAGVRGVRGKDAMLALALAKSVQVPAPMLEETKRTYDEAVDSGWGREDFSAVTHVVEKRIRRRPSGRERGPPPGRRMSAPSRLSAPDPLTSRD